MKSQFLILAILPLLLGYVQEEYLFDGEAYDAYMESLPVSDEAKDHPYIQDRAAAKFSKIQEPEGWDRFYQQGERRSLQDRDSNPYPDEDKMEKMMNSSLFTMDLDLCDTSLTVHITEDGVARVRYVTKEGTYQIMQARDGALKVNITDKWEQTLIKEEEQAIDNFTLAFMPTVSEKSKRRLQNEPSNQPSNEPGNEPSNEPNNEPSNEPGNDLNDPTSSNDSKDSKDDLSDSKDISDSKDLADLLDETNRYKTHVTYTFNNETQNGRLVLEQTGLRIQYKNNIASLKRNSTERSHAHTDLKMVDYKFHGLDWAGKYPDCGLPQQSPISLMPPVTPYGASYKFFSFEDDELMAEYTDIEYQRVESFEGLKTVEILASHSMGYLGFTSWVASNVWSISEKWDAYEFVFHHMSEHMVNEKRFDLEMQAYHTIHKDNEFTKRQQKVSEEVRELAVAEMEAEEEASSGDNTFAFSSEKILTTDFTVVSLLFDSKDYDKSLTPEEVDKFYDFFDEMTLNDTSPLVSRLSLGTIMGIADFSNRWMYKGSMTAPPCHQYVIWHVVQKVYPIREDQVASFRQKFEDMGVDYSDGKGNVRDVVVGPNREVYFVKSGARTRSLWLLALLGGVAAVLWS